jgi:hypothetical protein
VSSTSPLNHLDRNNINVRVFERKVMFSIFEIIVPILINTPQIDIADITRRDFCDRLSVESNAELVVLFVSM